ncbi:YIEGIA domain-containing protein [Carboxydochorda subterranea]|uniref:YIEGIA domain-containing protein n=1 Tax=Carboxydichorda subterranea TaxID=3109565 RepID=A0ABZ1C0T2_9FIRM|nr:YIEGIA domain-containing protein [Limnochorda sp. L945t]WRP18554.1 YIEGIA domain-containing protein [Limnochorda sp. L945t]
MSPAWQVVIATLAGTAVRFYTLKVDYRQYPSYPQGYTIHLSMGLIASFLGALAVPALAAREFAAASFLGLAATQFREVRKIEREALANLEETELVRRGAAYIEGIARVFEARNYVAMLVALIVSGVLTVLRPPHALWATAWAVLVTALALVTLARTARGLRLGDIATVQRAAIAFDGPLLTVEGAVVLNIGRAPAREIYQKQGVAMLLRPRDRAAAATLANPGQRQAILHDVVARVGVRMDVDEPEFAPIARRHVEQDAVVLVIIPQIADTGAIVRAIREVPVLEASVQLVGYGEEDTMLPRNLEADRRG